MKTYKMKFDNLGTLNTFKLPRINLLLLLSILALSLMTSCGDDDDDDIIGGGNNDYDQSYVKFTISGPSTNGTYEYKDAGTSDDFTVAGYFFTQETDPDLQHDQIQLYIGKSYTASHFLVVAPPSEGQHNISYLDGTNEFDIVITLEEIGNGYTAKDVDINITDLSLNGAFITHCKGNFSGSFYHHNLNESDVHQISGEFEFN